jgi:hypothetical protein
MVHADRRLGVLAATGLEDFVRSCADDGTEHCRYTVVVIDYQDSAHAPIRLGETRRRENGGHHTNRACGTTSSSVWNHTIDAQGYSSRRCASANLRR